MSPLEETESQVPVAEPIREAADRPQSPAGEEAMLEPDAVEFARSEAFAPEALNPAEAAVGPTDELAASQRADSVSGLMAAVQSLEDTVGRRLDLLQKSFDRELRAEANRERVVERLHSELQDYKQDLLLKVQRPIFIDLIQLHDDIGKMIDASATAPDESASTSLLAMTLESVRTAIEDILYRQGVEPFSLEGQAFDPRQQRAISTQATDEPSLNKQISARVRSGFRSGDKLIRPEIVSVFTYRPSV